MRIPAKDQRVSTRSHSNHMRNRLTAALAVSALALGACTDPTVPELNNAPEQTSVSSLPQIQNLASGLIDGDRVSHTTEVLYLETMARDAVRLDGSESRYVTNLLGATIDPSNFIGGAIWGAQYRNIRAAELFKTALSNSGDLTSASQKKAASGFATTIQANAYIRLSETRDTLGQAINTNPDSIVAIRCKPAVLANISNLLDQALVDLKAAAAGDNTFPFELPTGFTGFDTPSDFIKFNRALKAKVEMWRGFQALQSTATPAGGAVNISAVNRANLASADSAILASFYDPSPASFRTGVYHTFSIVAGETSNGLFAPAQIRANTKFVTEAEAGDTRVAAKTFVTDPVTIRSVTSNYGISVYQSASSPSPIIRDEQLVLYRALIQTGLGNYATALTLVNAVRTNYGLPAKTAANYNNFATALDQTNLIRETLKQIRYSMFFEAPDRLVLHRLFGLTAELGQERGFAPLTVLPLPVNESVARNGAVSCQQ